MHRYAKGFSLVEMMVALVAGMIVVAAVLAFTLSSLRSNRDLVGATRLTQELRTSLSFVKDELQRTGYDENALDFISQPPGSATTSPFSTMQIDDSDGDGINDCVVYAYDRLPGTPGQVDLVNGEIRAIRRVETSDGTGVIEFAESATGVTPNCGGGSADYSTYPVSCNASSGWCAVSDPRVLDVTTLRFTPNLETINGNPTAGIVSVQIRQIGVEIIGKLLNESESEIRRGVRSAIKVRADCLSSNVALNCTQAPTGV